jgi:hypothetical protein
MSPMCDCELATRSADQLADQAAVLGAWHAGFRDCVRRAAADVFDLLAAEVETSREGESWAP